MKRKSRAVRIGTIALAVAAACAIGFVLGSSTAPDQRDAHEARQESFRASFADSEAAAFGQAHRMGTLKGLKQGRSRAKRAGVRRGGSAGGAKVEAKLARIAQEEAEAAAQAEAEERAANCGAPLFVEGYCPTDEEVEQENLAESLCGPNDPALEEEAEQYGIEC